MLATLCGLFITCVACHPFAVSPFSFSSWGKIPPRVPFLRLFLLFFYAVRAQSEMFEVFQLLFCKEMLSFFCSWSVHIPSTHRTSFTLTSAGDFLHIPKWLSTTPEYLSGLAFSCGLHVCGGRNMKRKRVPSHTENLIMWLHCIVVYWDYRCCFEVPSTLMVFFHCLANPTSDRVDLCQTRHICALCVALFPSQFCSHWKGTASGRGAGWAWVQVSQYVYMHVT